MITEPTIHQLRAALGASLFKTTNSPEMEELRRLRDAKRTWFGPEHSLRFEIDRHIEQTAFDDAEASYYARLMDAAETEEDRIAIGEEYAG